VQKRPRGRPRGHSDPRLAEADATIARTVWQLVAWGYPLRRTVAPLVARLARSVLGRGSGHGGVLSAERVEQLMESWLLREGGGWRCNGRKLPFKPWARYAVDSLRGRRPPGYTLDQLTLLLLKQRGTWQAARPRYVGDAVLTAKAHAEWLLAPRLKWIEPQEDGNDEADETG
jgi:hypothetical protein